MPQHLAPPKPAGTVMKQLKRMFSKIKNEDGQKTPSKSQNSGKTQTPPSKQSDQPRRPSDYIAAMAPDSTVEVEVDERKGSMASINSNVQAHSKQRKNKNKNKKKQSFIGAMKVLQVGGDERKCSSTSSLSSSTTSNSRVSDCSNKNSNPPSPATTCRSTRTSLASFATSSTMSTDTRETIHNMLHGPGPQIDYSTPASSASNNSSLLTSSNGIMTFKDPFSRPASQSGKPSNHTQPQTPKTYGSDGMAATRRAKRLNSGGEHSSSMFMRHAYSRSP